VFYDCLVASSSNVANGSPSPSPSSSTHVGPFTRQRFDELLSLASKSNAKEEMKKVAKYAWETEGAWTVPCMVACKVPLEDTEKVSKEEREKDMFMTCDRFEMMAYL
jgi:hypothetical protein